MGVWQRVRQVGYYLAPHLEADDVAWAHGWLGERQVALFEAMTLPDRAHAVRVARRLAAQDAPPHVLEAALLHDCGKPAGYGLVGRCLGVLAGLWLDRLPAEPPLAGLARQLQIYRWHDAWGLAAARAAGTSPEALALLEAYLQPDGQKQEAPAWLGPLAAADNGG